MCLSVMSRAAIVSEVPAMGPLPHGPRARVRALRVRRGHAARDVGARTRAHSGGRAAAPGCGSALASQRAFVCFGKERWARWSWPISIVGDDICFFFLFGSFLQPPINRVQTWFVSGLFRVHSGFIPGLFMERKNRCHHPRQRSAVIRMKTRGNNILVRLPMSRGLYQ